MVDGASGGTRPTAGPEPPSSTVATMIATVNEGIGPHAWAQARVALVMSALQDGAPPDCGSS
jgi:hypothetical protein